MATISSLPLNVLLLVLIEAIDSYCDISNQISCEISAITLSRTCKLWRNVLSHNKRLWKTPFCDSTVLQKSMVQEKSDSSIIDAWLVNPREIGFVSEDKDKTTPNLTLRETIACFQRQTHLLMWAENCLSRTAIQDSPSIALEDLHRMNCMWLNSEFPFYVRDGRGSTFVIPIRQSLSEAIARRLHHLVLLGLRMDHQDWRVQEGVLSMLRHSPNLEVLEISSLRHEIPLPPFLPCKAVLRMLKSLVLGGWVSQQSFLMRIKAPSLIDLDVSFVEANPATKMRTIWNPVDVVNFLKAVPISSARFQLPDTVIREEDQIRLFRALPKSVKELEFDFILSRTCCDDLGWEVPDECSESEDEGIRTWQFTLDPCLGLLPYLKFLKVKVLPATAFEVLEIARMLAIRIKYKRTFNAVFTVGNGSNSNQSEIWMREYMKPWVESGHAVIEYSSY